MSVDLVRHALNGASGWGVVTRTGVVPLPAEYGTTADVLIDGVKLARTLVADPRRSGGSCSSRASPAAAYLTPGDRVVASIRTDDGTLDLGAQHNTIR